jgi:hypothetical protein
MNDGNLRYALAMGMIKTIFEANAALFEIMANEKPEEELIEFAKARFTNIVGFGQGSYEFLEEKTKENTND